MVPLRFYDFMGATKTDGLETRFFFCYVYIYIYIHVICFLSFFVCEDCKTKKKHIWSSGCLFFWNNQDQFCSGMNEFGLV